MADSTLTVDQVTAAVEVPSNIVSDPDDIKVTAKELTLYGQGGIVFVGAYSKVPVFYSCSEDWITIEPQSDGAFVHVALMTEAEDLSESREATIKIAHATEDSYTKEIKIVQHRLQLAKGISILGDNVVEVAGDATEIPVTISAKKHWHANTNNSWLRLVTGEEKEVRMSGHGSQVVTVQVDENTTGEARRSSIKFRSGRYSAVVIVSQSAKD